MDPGIFDNVSHQDRNPSGLSYTLLNYFRRTHVMTMGQKIPGIFSSCSVRQCKAANPLVTMLYRKLWMTFYIYFKGVVLYGMTYLEYPPSLLVEVKKLQNSIQQLKIREVLVGKKRLPDKSPAQIIELIIRPTRVEDPRFYLLHTMLYICIGPTLYTVYYKTQLCIDWRVDCLLFCGGSTLQTVPKRLTKFSIVAQRIIWVIIIFTSCHILQMGYSRIFGGVTCGMANLVTPSNGGEYKNPRYPSIRNQFDEKYHYFCIHM